MTESTNIVDPPQEESIINIGAKRKSAYGGINNKLKGEPNFLRDLLEFMPACTESIEIRQSKFANIYNYLPAKCKLFQLFTRISRRSAIDGAAFPQNSTKKHALLHSFTARTRALFTKKLNNLHRNPRFLSLSINDTLNSLYNKDLHKYFSPA